MAYVSNSTLCYEENVYYWTAEKPGKAEIDFIVQDGENIVPIEVKTGSGARARSIGEYHKKYSPKKSVLTSLDNNKENILPLYSFWKLKDWLNDGTGQIKTANTAI